jgi:hemerythrin superfamily protein
MTRLTDKLTPDATTQIRLDHSHVLATFRQYHPDSSPKVKQGLVGSACLALEIHAQLEEEIFYPALRHVSDNPVLQRSQSEHEEMRRLIGLLRGMEPSDARYDETFMTLMRSVLHHVADEETTLLPEAERMLPERLTELGRQMTRRRLQLAGPRAGEIAASLARAMPRSTIAVTLGMLAAGLWLGMRIARA